MARKHAEKHAEKLPVSYDFLLVHRVPPKILRGVIDIQVVLGLAMSVDVEYSNMYDKHSKRVNVWPIGHVAIIQSHFHCLDVPLT